MSTNIWEFAVVTERPCGQWNARRSVGRPTAGFGNLGCPLASRTVLNISVAHVASATGLLITIQIEKWSLWCPVEWLSEF